MRDREPILVGVITKIRGLKGQLRVFPLTDLPEQLVHLKTVMVLKVDSWTEYPVEGVTLQGRFAFFKLAGIDTAEAAEALAGRELYIEAGQRIRLPKNHYYLDEIADFEVLSLSDEEVGRLVEVKHFPASDMLIIDRGGKEVMIPFVKELVLEVNLKSRRIVVADMPSLWE